jgi:hypothetical protein
MTHDDDTLALTPELLRVRADLMAAITADARRHARPRRVRMLGIALVASLAGVGTAVAATAGLFEPAPRTVQQAFERVDGVEAGKAVAIGVIDDHAAYAAPTADGGFCLHFADNPRSGPSGQTCVPRGAGPGEVAFAVQLGNDGGFVFGRAGDTPARTVEVAFPAGGGTLTTRVGEERFFVAPLTPRAQRSLTVFVEPGPTDPPTKDGGPLESLDLERVAAVTAVARDASGRPIARGKPIQLLEPGTTTTTTAP